MKLDNHISELLYHHNCVIVADFGGFVAQYKSASVHPVQHSFSPPSKQIAFNESLRNNDGLLASYISQKLDISYPEACNLISNFVSHCNDELAKGKKIVVDKIGTLFFDIEHNLQFVPDSEVNYLLDSFGFSSFQSPAIKRDERMFEMPETESFVSFLPKKKRKSKLWRLLEVIPAAAIITYLILNTNFTTQINTGLAGLNPFANSVEQFEKINAEAANKQPVIETVVASPPAENKAEVPAMENAAIQETVQVPEEKTIAEPAPVAKSEISVPENIPPSRPADVVKKPVAFETDAANKFFVIGGCFSIFENAEKLVAQLKSDGYPAQLLGKNKRGLEMVGIASAKNHSKAEEMLGFIQDSGYPDAWIFRKK